jgi:hypothetical protein
MAPNKIDTKIKEQLGSREIKPTGQAWDRLDAMLSVAENKKKKNYSWIYIAASFILFSSVGFWFYNQNNEEIIIKNNNVVTNDSAIDTLKTKNNIKENEIFVNKKGVRLVENNNEYEQKREQISSTVIKTNETIKVKKTEEQKSKLLAENKKAEIKVEEITITNETNKYVTAELLLASVENRNIEKKQLNKVDKKVNSTLKVSTSSLLSSVETELDVEFRENNLEKISRNFNQVRSALANRNYE